jgi:hypothetical protein
MPEHLPTLDDNTQQNPLRQGRERSPEVIYHSTPSNTTVSPVAQSVDHHSTDPLLTQACPSLPLSSNVPLMTSAVDSTGTPARVTAVSSESSLPQVLPPAENTSSTYPEIARQSPPSHQSLNNVPVPPRASSLPGSFGFGAPRQFVNASTVGDSSSEYSSLPERSSPRVRWDIPQSSPASSSNPPPSTYRGTITPLWTSTSPGLRTFPPSAYPTGQTPPWYYGSLPFTPLRQLPPVAPNLLHSAYSMNHTLPSVRGGTMSANSTSASQPRFFRTPAAPHMQPQPLDAEDLSSHIPESTYVGQPPQGMYTYQERPHERFFLPDGNIDFRINNVLFRVHSHFFFPEARTLLIMGPLLPPVVDLTALGITPYDFELLLSIFYPRTYGSLEIQTVENWSLVLKAASALNMREIRKLAIKQLSIIASPVDRIMLAREHGVDRWLIPAFKELCTTRSRPLSDVEGRKLGVEGLIKLANMKYELQEYTTEYLDSAKVDQMVRDLVEH